MQQDILLPFELPAVARKKVCIAFDGGMLSSDAGVLLLRGVEQRLSIATRLAACLTDHRDPNRIDHTLVEMLRSRGEWSAKLGDCICREMERLHREILAFEARVKVNRKKRAAVDAASDSRHQHQQQ